MNRPAITLTTSRSKLEGSRLAFPTHQQVAPSLQGSALKTLHWVAEENVSSTAWRENRPLRPSLLK